MYPSLLPEIGPDGIARESPVIAYTEKIIEEEQLQVKRYIEENYSKIRDVERELANLNLELKLTAGPKKAALEHLRKKIELSTERVRAAKLKEEQARKVQESANSQFARLEELKKRLEALNPSRASTCDLPDSKSAQQPVGYTPAPNATATNSAVQSKTVGLAVQQPKTNSGSEKDGKVSGVSGSEADSEVKQKKKPVIVGRGRGTLVIPKGRGGPQTGWTGAGFDVDGST